MTFCLIPEKVQEFKRALKDGTLNPDELGKMTSEERRAFLEKLVGKENGVQVNGLFESKLLLKNQQRGYITWAKKVSGITPQAKRDLISRIERMDKILSPEEEKVFLQDLASTRLGFGVTEQEAKTISDLSKKVQEARTLQKEDLTFADETQRIAYGRAKVELMNYTNDLKEGTKRLSLADRAKPTNVRQNLSDVAGNAKSIKASLDNSAIFRQGWKTLMTNPLIWQRNARKTFVDIFKTFGGKQVMDELNADIVSRPNYERMVKAKLAIGTIEEAYPGTIATKVPLAGRVFKASENAFTGFVYRQRADIFDKYLEIAKRSGINIDDPKELQPIASMVNSLTGRGNLGRLEGSTATTLNNIFFSPRFLKSQVDTLGHVFTGAGGSNFVRKQAAVNLVKVITGTAAVLAIANAVRPGSVETDPRSADFGKIKIGNTRFDVTGGSSALITLAARLLKMSSKSSTTGMVSPINSGEFGAQTGKDVIYNFFENKLSPAAAVIRNYFEGQDREGRDPKSAESILETLFVPIGVTTYRELEKDPNSADTLLAMIVDNLGIGANTYGKSESEWAKKPTKAQTAFKEKVGESKFREANNEFNKQYDEWYKTTHTTDSYKNLSNEAKQKAITKSRDRIQENVFKKYGFKYKEPKETTESKQEKKQIESLVPK
ncbi:MAG: hypothetical protein NUV69_00450 [Candidatus Curtissbacteria bacterium]|nr:hypothetical protein [Candidatus Curtissbacteria bacterium]